MDFIVQQLIEEIKFRLNIIIEGVECNADGSIQTFAIQKPRQSQYREAVAIKLQKYLDKINKRTSDCKLELIAKCCSIDWKICVRPK